MYLEKNPNSIMTLEEWDCLLGDEGNMAREFLSMTDRTILEVGCTNDPKCDCRHLVRKDYSPTHVFADCCCDRKCDCIKIDKADLIGYEWYRQKIDEAIAGAADIQRSPGEDGSTEFPGTTYLGIFDAPSGMKVIVFLLTLFNRDSYASVVKKLITRNPYPVIILSPTRSCFTPELEHWVEQKKSAMLAIREYFAWDDSGNLILRRPFVDDLPPSMNTPKAGLKQAKFKKNGSDWEYEFEGRSANLGSNKGNDVIHYLIETSPYLTPAIGMRRAIEGYWQIEIPNARSTVFDEQALKSYQARLSQIEAELVAAKAKKDRKKIRELKDERKWIRTYICNSLNSKKKIRNDAKADENERKAISKLVRYQLAIIKAIDPIFGEHLEESLKIGEYLAYQPKEPIDWET